MKNPFQFGKVVRDKQFCNRKKEIENILMSIESGSSLWLYSPRRFGKTSLIVNAFDKIHNVKTIYFDLYNIRDSQEFSVKYLNILSKELFNRKTSITSTLKKLSGLVKNITPTVSLDSMGNPSIGFDVKPKVLNESIESILNIPEKINFSKPICIAFDEFQEIYRIDPFLINIMRSVFQHQQNICYIFLGSKEALMKQIFSDGHSPFFEFGRKINLTPISSEELSAYIKTMFSETKLTITDQTIEDILELTAGHPHFTQYVASVIWDLIFQGIEQDLQFHNLWEDRLLESQSDSFSIIYDQLNNNQRKILYIISCSEVQNFYSEGIRKKYDLPAKSTITTTLNSLIQKSLLVKYDGIYKLENPLFKLWNNKMYEK